MVITLWLAIFAGLIGVLAAGGNSEHAEDAIPDSQATLALQRMNEKFPGSEQTDAQTLHLVFHPSEGFVTDDAAKYQIDAVLAEAAELPGVASVANPFDPEAPYVSVSARTAVSTLTYSEARRRRLRRRPTRPHWSLQQNAPAALGVEPGGNLVPLGAPEQGIGEALGVLIAFIVLIFTYGSLRAAGANLGVAVFGVGVGVIGVLAFNAISPISENSIILAAMLGLAVGIDYSLFIMSRFQHELRGGRSVDEAIGRAIGTAGTAVVFAGLTVIVALGALTLVGINFIAHMGLAAAFAVLVAVLLALTLVPVFLKTFGLKMLSKKHRKALESGVVWHEGDGSHDTFLRKWARFVVKRPVMSLIAGAGVLVVVGIPVLSMKTAFNVPGGADPESTERAAYTAILEDFGGVQSPLIVLMEGEDVEDQTTTVTTQVGNLPGVQSVSPAQISDDGQMARITVIPTGGPIDDETKEIVHIVRNEARAVPGVHLEVTGETAIGIDQDAALNAALIKYVIVIVVISLALLVLLFRSILIPVIATAGYLVSVIASFGASTAVFQWGWDFPLITAAQGDPMMTLLPILLVGVLFGLAMDYQVFLVSRIQEMHSKGLSPKDAIVEGFGRAAPVLVAAATIMTVVFAGFASSSFAIAASIAFGLMVGVVADAFIVRLVLMPAAMSLLGKAAWWMPRWLDKVLPTVDTEGHALDAHEASVPTSVDFRDGALTRSRPHSTPRAAERESARRPLAWSN
ncbi:membrane protein [Demequina litorisediminis]|uniref:Membrane protein n=1 Tax=Demequina litorisediminis TaxID=1849022 RepID=A0ABQ6I9I0_9MICO|nr:membrane protein [Demequina litorisediminis]